MLVNPGRERLGETSAIPWPGVLLLLVLRMLRFHMFVLPGHHRRYGGMKAAKRTTEIGSI